MEAANSVIVITNSIILLILILSAGILLWLIIRELNCWYFKINERVKLQKEMNETLKRIVDILNLPSNSDGENNGAEN